MGKDFVPLRINGLDWLKALELLACAEVKEASSEAYFRVRPAPYEVIGVELGTDGTNETVLSLKSGDFVVLAGTLSLDLLILQREARRE